MFERFMTLLTLYYYLQSSLKNPGFIQGNTLYEVAVRKFIMKFFIEHWSLQSEHGHNKKGEPRSI